MPTYFGEICMKRARLQAATVGGTPDEVEQAFYEALQHGLIDQMMACWAEEDEIVCVHPGGSRLIGAGRIRSAFETLFSHGGVKAVPEQVHKIEALASAVHHLVERVEVSTPNGPRSGWVYATNVYHKTAQGWRMVAHHASPGEAQAEASAAGMPSVLH